MWTATLKYVHKIKHEPTLKITLPYKPLPNSTFSSTTSTGNISVFKIKQINSTMHINEQRSYTDILRAM